MHTNTLLLHINAALNTLRRVEAVAATLPKKHALEFPWSSCKAAIRGLETAKASITGEAMPVAATVDYSDLDGIIDGDDDWKKHDHADHEAGAAYYDEVAQAQ